MNLMRTCSSDFNGDKNHVVGTIHSLEKLQKESSLVENVKRKISETQRSILSLQRKVKVLQEQKSYLTNRIRKFELLTHNEDSSKSGEELSQDEDKKRVDLPELTEREIEFRLLREIINVYRLTGVSVENIEKSHLLIRIDTSCTGQFFEPHFVELQRGDKSWSVFKHSLPYFIPLTALGDKHLPNLERFTFKVINYLNPFVYRREECINFQKEFGGYLHGEVTNTDAFDHIRFNLSENSGYLQVELGYTELTSYLPTEVTICQMQLNETSSPIKRDTIMSWEKILKSLPLTEAVQRITESEESSVTESIMSSP